MVLPPLQAFLLPTPHQCDLQMDEGPALQQRRLSQLLQGTVFPEFVSAPSFPAHLLQVSHLLPWHSQELRAPQCPHSPPEPSLAGRARRE